MDTFLEEACAILDDFEKEVTDVKATWDRIAADNSHLEETSPDCWKERYCRMWLHGASDVWTLTELGRWLTDYPPTTALANAPAQKIYGAWREWLLTSGPVKTIKVSDYDKRSRSYDPLKYFFVWSHFANAARPFSGLGKIA
ncbi:MAG: hypothetical protein KGI80_03430 [Verrucomicrobiota bacterium]|nr:hypothetical protein [Verrucomicrobiota bacterium]